VDYGDPWELNRYGYTGGNPGNYSDPTGWNALKQFGSIIINVSKGVFRISRALAPFASTAIGKMVIRTFGGGIISVLADCILQEIQKAGGVPYNNCDPNQNRDAFIAGMIIGSVFGVHGFLYNVALSYSAAAATNFITWLSGTFLRSALISGLTYVLGTIVSNQLTGDAATDNLTLMNFAINFLYGSVLAFANISPKNAATYEAPIRAAFSLMIYGTLTAIAQTISAKAYAGKEYELTPQEIMAAFAVGAANSFGVSTSPFADFWGAVALAIANVISESMTGDKPNS
jgi:hypothetical protein